MSELRVRIMKLRATALALRDPAAGDALLAIATGMDAGLDLLTPSAGRASVAEGRGHLRVSCAERQEWRGCGLVPVRAHGARLFGPWISSQTRGFGAKGKGRDAGVAFVSGAQS